MYRKQWYMYVRNNTISVMSSIGSCLYHLKQSYNCRGSSLTRLWKSRLIIHQIRGAKSGKPSDGDKKAQDIATAGPPQANMEVCEGANIYKTGSDPLLKEDSAYPSWLWTIAEPISSQRDLELSRDTRQHHRRLNKIRSHERNAVQRQMGNR